eukprot:5427077-Pleurochrysis_carterae.AAC.2
MECFEGQRADELVWRQRGNGRHRSSFRALFGGRLAAVWSGSVRASLERRVGASLAGRQKLIGG